MTQTQNVITAAQVEEALRFYRDAKAKAEKEPWARVNLIAERERCAQVADSYAKKSQNISCWAVCRAIADEIRRGE
jgi:hypothetical protein